MHDIVCVQVLDSGTNFFADKALAGVGQNPIVDNIAKCGAITQLENDVREPLQIAHSKEGDNVRVTESNQYGFLGFVQWLRDLVHQSHPMRTLEQQLIDYT